MTEKEIFQYFIKAGLSQAGTAGLMGNLYAESGLRFNNLQNIFEKKLGLTDEQYTMLVDSGFYSNFVRDGAGYGLAQWTFWTRKQNLLNLARQRGTSIADSGTQLTFLLTELATYGELWATLKTTADIDYASDLVLTRFERPKDMSEAVRERRREYSREIFARCTSGESTEKAGKETGEDAPEKEETLQGGDSPLATVHDWTNKNGGKRTEPITKITIHHMAGNMAVKDCMKYHRTCDRSVSANYYIGSDGEIGQAVHESDRAWTSSSSWNDNRAVTIEVANNKTGDPWPISEAAYKSLIALCTDICKRNGIKGVKYTGTKDGSLTEHRMFKNTACPGETIHELLESHIIEYDINSALSGHLEDAYISGSGENEMPAEVFKVRISAEDLNIRSGPGTDYKKNGKCPPGTYTIVSESPGRGSTKGWGTLKSGAGWVSLDYTDRLS